MYNDNDPDRKKTKLKRGDSVIWYKNTETIQLNRKLSRLKQSANNDDKYIIRMKNENDFLSLVKLLAESHGFNINLVHTGPRIVEYQFR